MTAGNLIDNNGTLMLTHGYVGNKQHVLEGPNQLGCWHNITYTEGKQLE